MSDFNDDPKIIRLPVSVASTPTAAPNNELSVRAEVSQLMGEAEPAPPSAELEPKWLSRRHDQPIQPAPESDWGSEPGHRNGTVCPQCDRWTWRATELCIYCRYNLFEHAKREAQERHMQWIARRQQRLPYWALGLTAGGMAMIFLFRSLPNALEWPIAAGGLLAFAGASICVKLMKQHGQHR